MRAGRLNSLVTVTAPSGTETLHWVEWLEQPPTGDAVPEGLRSGADITLRHRNLPPMEAGSWVSYDGRLLRVNWTSPSEKVRHAYESICTEFAGQNADYLPALGDPLPCRVFIERNAEYIGEVGRVQEYRTRIEILKHQLYGHTPTLGDRLQLGSETFDIEGLAPGGDDGLVLQLVAV